MFLFIVPFAALLAPEASAAQITTETYTGLEGDAYGHTTGNVSDYADIWGAATGNIYNSSAWIDVGQQLGNGIYSVSRAFLYFDTSNIPAGAIITEATVSLRVQYDNSDEDFYVVIQGKPLYPEYPVTDYSFYQANYGSANNLGSNTSFLADVEGWFNIPLNTAGKTYIDQAGVTRFALRSSNDIAKIAPIGWEELEFYSYEAGDGYRPTLTVTYSVAGGSGGGGTNYNYRVYGPYTDEGTIYRGTASVKVYPSDNTTVNFDLASDGSTIDYFDLALTSKPISMTWNISSGANYSRAIYFTNVASETLYIQVPTVDTPFYLYTFTTYDYYGLSNAYLEALSFFNGSNKVTERQRIDSINNVPMFLTWGRAYTLRVISDNGTLTIGGFTALAETASTVVVPYGAFPANLWSLNATASARRVSATEIQVNYSDPDEATNWVTVQYQHMAINGTYLVDYITNSTSFPLVDSWSGADASTDYRVLVTANRADGVKYWSFSLLHGPQATNIFAPLNNLGDGLPFAMEYFLGVILVVAAILAFSFWHISIGAWAGWGVAALCVYLGWLPNYGTTTAVVLGFAAFICAGITIGEFKRNERTV